MYIVYPVINFKMQQDSSTISPCKAVHDIARQNKVRNFHSKKTLSFFHIINKILAEYQLEKESGPAHAKIYTIRLRLGDKHYIGVDRSIKLAQRAAAQIALNDHKHLLPIKNPNQEVNGLFIGSFSFQF